MSAPLVSVIIACKNTARYFERCLGSVRAQTYPQVEIIVVDNFSTDGTYEIAKKYADKVFQKGPERSTQFNVGFQQSKGEYIYRIGPDYVLEPDVVEKCVVKMQEGFAALALHNRSIGDSIWAKVRYLERESYRNDKSIVAVRFMRREVFESVGGFDESLVAGEDFDLHRRITEAGYAWSHVEAIENHVGEPRNLADVWNKFYYYGRTISRYKAKNTAAASRQMVFFRPSFKGLQKQLLREPGMFAAFWFYMAVKAAAALFGMIRGAPSSLKSSPEGLPRPHNKETGTPLVSVIVPTKNSAQFLEACLNSIKSQTYPNIELVVVDNNSIDNTKEIAKKYTNNVFNHGPERSAQVNFGAKQAKGEYIYKVDSDFVLDPEVLKQCVNRAAEGYEAVVVHNSPDTRVSWIAKIRKFEVDMYKYDLTHSAARFVKKELYAKIGGLNERIIWGEDLDFQNRINRAGIKTGFIEAEALHLGEPKRFLQHMRKWYFYGKDMVNYKAYNQPESKQQLAIIRRVYLKNWRRFVRHPFLGLGFVLYNLSKYGWGGAGYVVSRYKMRITDGAPT